MAAFALLLRLFVEALGPIRADWGLIMGILAAITMTVGNLAALGQDNIKRMLAYSSIAHTGYIMVGLAVFAEASDPSVQAAGIQGVLFYAVAYTFMNLGAFACVAALQRRPGVTSQISTFAGLGRRAPLLGIAMTLFLLSLVGIPPTAGFFGKAVIVISAVQGGGWLTVLAVILMLNAAAAAFYYLRVVVTMYMREAPDNARPVVIGGLTRFGLVIAAGVTIILGLVRLDHDRHARLDHERGPEPAARRLIAQSRGGTLDVRPPDGGTCLVMVGPGRSTDRVPEPASAEPGNAPRPPATRA